MRTTVLTLLLALSGCARYAPHDPSSYCLERVAKPVLRPASACEVLQGAPSPQCNWAVVVEIKWQCQRWSSW